RRPRLADWVEEYGLADREQRVRVADGSPLAGKTLEELRLRVTSGASLVAVERGGRLIQPAAKTELRAGDVLLVDLFGPGADVGSLRKKYALEEQPLTGAYFTDLALEIGMAELVLPASSDVVGKTVAGARFRDRYGLTVIGLRRGAAALGRGLQNE